MSFANILCAVICSLCASIFGAIALWAFKREDAMHFWSGSTVKPQEIADVAAYNRANGLMWAIYTVCMVITGISSLFSITLGVIFLGILCVPGLFILVAVYKRIYAKYKSI